MRTWIASRRGLRKLAAAAALSVAAIGSSAAAQQPQVPRPADVTGLAPGEVMRLLDAYAVMQAQDALRLDEKQYPQFVQRFKRLQDARRKGNQVRTRLIQELNLLTRLEAAVPDEAAVRRKLGELAEQEASASAEAARARSAIDELLTIVQQGRLRVFEEHMERRKLELLSRARQGARQGQGQRRQPAR